MENLDFDFYKTNYYPEMFDKDFINKHKEFFLSENAPLKLKNKYYNKKLEFIEIIENLEYLDGKNIEVAVPSYEVKLKQLIELFKENTIEFIKKYKSLIISLSEMKLEIPEEYRGKLLDDKTKKSIIAENIENYSEKNGYFFLSDFDQLKMLLDFIPLKDLKLNRIPKNIIEKYGIEYLEKSGINIKYFTCYNYKDGSHGVNKNLTNIKDILNLKNILEPDELRKIVYLNNSENFYNDDINFSLEILKKYGIKKILDCGFENLDELSNLTAEKIRENPKIAKLIENQDENWQNMLVKNGKPTKDISTKEKLRDFVIKLKLPKSEFLDLCEDYGICLDYIVCLENDDGENKITNQKFSNIKEFRDFLEYKIYNEIKNNYIEYFDDFSLNFKKEHSELFLPENIDKNLREKFCQGKLSFDDIKNNPELKKVLESKNIDVGLSENMEYLNILEKNVGSKKEVLNYIAEYGNYLKYVDIYQINQENLSKYNQDEKKKIIENIIENQIISGRRRYDGKAPDFFKKKHPELFLDENSPEDLKDWFYNNTKINLQGFVDHPEWIKYVKNKDLGLKLSYTEEKLMDVFDIEEIVKLRTKYKKNVSEMANREKAELLKKWYYATGKKFLPHYTVMIDFPEDEIDLFLKNGKKWSKLVRSTEQSLNDDGKSAILKVAYCLGVFHGDNKNFQEVLKLFTDIPNSLTIEQFEKIKNFKEEKLHEPDFKFIDYFLDENEQEKLKNERKELLKNCDITLSCYKLNDDGKYILNIDKQKEKQKAKIIRKILEKSNFSSGILTPEFAHQMFGAFKMKYDPEFAKFFMKYKNEILNHPENAKFYAQIQKRFDEIKAKIAGMGITLENAMSCVQEISYDNIDIGNEDLAKWSKIAKYSQDDFDFLQKVYNDGELREFSSIPRVEGKQNDFTYEILRLDDSLATAIGTLTDCCQEVENNAESCMLHSMESPDGRIFCVRNSEGEIVAQSWVWRNNDTICFDNIEIPHKLINSYSRNNYDEKDRKLEEDVLEVYKKASHEIMEKDPTLRKITIGLGYNDIANAIKFDESLRFDESSVMPPTSSEFTKLYTDADKQYIVEKRENVTHRNEDYVFEDDIPIYDNSNMNSNLLFTMKRMENAVNKDNLENVNEIKKNGEKYSSDELISNIAENYGLIPENTKIIASNRIAIIYSKDDDDNLILADIFSSPIKQNLTEEKKQIAKNHLIYQLKKALGQIVDKNSKIDLSQLDNEQKQIVENELLEIKNNALITDER